jgi:hypothetical protein
MILQGLAVAGRRSGRLPAPARQAGAGRGAVPIGIVLAVVGLVLGIAVPIALLELRVSARLRDLAERASRRRVVQALVRAAPAARDRAGLAARRRVPAARDARVRASVQSWGGWLGDWTKQQLVTWAIAVPMVLGLYAIVRRTPPLVVLLLAADGAGRRALVFVEPVARSAVQHFRTVETTQPQLVEPIER